MEDKIFNTVKEFELINKDDNIVLGLSGGPDSMALLYVLIAIKEKIDFSIFIAHVNHGVRGKDALKDEEFVKNLANSLKLPFFSKRVDMVKTARLEGISQEEAGRKLRYGFFREIIKTIGKGKIAVAHNKDDQAETLLMRIIRGTGIDGLKGMDYKIDDIIRPILNIYRFEIEDYIKHKGIETVLDKTNLQSIYTRNKVRLELIPYIENNFNPNLIDTLFRLSENAARDIDLLNKVTDERYKSLVKERTSSKVLFEYKFYENELKAIKARVIRKAILELNKNLQGIEEVHILSVIELFDKRETGKSIDLPFNIRARVSYDDLIIEKEVINEELPSQDKSFNLQLGENIIQEYGLEIKLEIIKPEEVDFKNKAENIQYFDFDKVKGKIAIRSRKDGDSFHPFGMKGRKKLKDFFIDEKIARNLRDTIPLLVDKESIIWVIGYRTSETYKIDKDTSKVLRVISKNTEKTGGL